MPIAIVRVLERRPDGGLNSVSTLNYLDWAEQNTVFEVISPRIGWAATWTGGDEPVAAAGRPRVDADFFEIYGMRAAHGRLFVPGEDELGNDKVVVLSTRFWENRFGADPAAVGRSIVLNGEPHEIIGVLEAERRSTAIRRRSGSRSHSSPSNMTRDFHWFGVSRSSRPGVTLEQARAEMDVIGKRIAAEYPAIRTRVGASASIALEDVIGGPQLRTAVLAHVRGHGVRRPDRLRQPREPRARARRRARARDRRARRARREPVALGAPVPHRERLDRLCGGIARHRRWLCDDEVDRDA